MSDNPDYYEAFINGLRGMIDDAELEGWDQDGLAHLREALEYFSSDHRILLHTQQEGREREASLRGGRDVS